MEPRKYIFSNSTVTVVFGDILMSQSEVIVSSDDTAISMGGGLSGYILKNGGVAIREDAQRKLPAQLGDVILSAAGHLTNQKFIFHSITLDYEHKEDFYTGKLVNADDVNKYILRHTVDKCFKLLQALDLQSIAFPCIGAGLANIPIQQIAAVMAEAIAQNLCRTQKSYQVEFYLYDHKHLLKELDYIDIFENFAVRSALAQLKQSNTEQLAEEVSEISSMPSGALPKRDEMNHQVFISYSRRDMEKVEGIKNILEENGIPYWIDKEGIFSGENYKEVIVDAIDIAKVVIFVSSANSNASINVIRELGYAVKQRKIIVPLIIDDASYAKSIRLDIADIDQIEFNNSELAKKKLLTSLAYAMSR